MKSFKRNEEWQRRNPNLYIGGCKQEESNEFREDPKAGIITPE